MIDIKIGDCRQILKQIDDKTFNTCITSPPYFGLRDYGNEKQIGLENTPDNYVDELVNVFREVYRVLKDDGTLWLNLGDSYNTTQAGNKNFGSGVGANKHYTNGSIPKKRNISKILKTKDLIGIPWKVAFALQKDGWYLRQDIIWHKPNPMPESVLDRCTKAHEYIFLLTKNSQYYFDNEAIKEDATYKGASRGGSTNRYEQNNFGGDNKEYDTRNKRSVWTVNPKPYKDAHFATYPPNLIEPCVLAGCPVDGKILDPFGGAGTTGLVADRLGRNATLIELNSNYASIANKRLNNDAPLFSNINIKNEIEK